MKRKGRNKRQDIWQHVKQAQLYSDLLHALKRVPCLIHEGMLKYKIKKLRGKMCGWTNSESSKARFLWKGRTCDASGFFSKGSWVSVPAEANLLTFILQLCALTGWGLGNGYVRQLQSFTPGTKTTGPWWATSVFYFMSIYSKVILDRWWSILGNVWCIIRMSLRGNEGIVQAWLYPW